MHVSKRQGKREMISLEMRFEAATRGLKYLFESSDDRVLYIVFQHKKEKKLHSVAKEGRRFKFQLHMALEENKQNMAATKAAEDIKQKTKQACQGDMKET